MSESKETMTRERLDELHAAAIRWEQLFSLKNKEAVEVIALARKGLELQEILSNEEQDKFEAYLDGAVRSEFQKLRVQIIQLTQQLAETQQLHDPVVKELGNANQLIVEQMREIKRLNQQLADARRDSERLDWLEKVSGLSISPLPELFSRGTAFWDIRKAIDALTDEAKGK